MRAKVRSGASEGEPKFLSLRERLGEGDAVQIRTAGTKLVSQACPRTPTLSRWEREFGESTFTPAARAIQATHLIVQHSSLETRNTQPGLPNTVARVLRDVVASAIQLHDEFRIVHRNRRDARVPPGRG